VLSCREATRLLSEGQDRPLQFRERASLRLHLAMCASCRRFCRQLDVMRLALRELPQRELPSADYAEPRE
jgi:hypothetical protein